MSVQAATLFSGIGAPEQAMPHWSWAWHAEIEKFPAAVMAARHTDSVNLGDVTADDFTTRAAEIGRPDVLVFGSPCQSYSIAGKRLGLDDPRGNLALVALGIVDQLKPRWFLFENVPGLLSSSEGRDFGLFLRAVDELGYSLCWSVLDAQHFGVAQRRQRVFAVGYLGDWRYPAAVLLEPQGLCGDHPPRRKAGEGVAPTIASRPTGGGGLGTDFDCDGGLIAGTLGTRSAAHPSGVGGETDFIVAHALNAGGCGRIDYESETFVTHALRADGFDASEDGTGRGTPLVVAFDTTQITSRENRCRPEPGDPCHPLAAGAHAPTIAFSCKDHGADASDLAPTLRAMGHSGSHANAGGQVAIAFAQNQLGEVRAGDIFNTLNTNSNASGRNTPMAHVGTAVRRLTPRECERLQGFPDDFTAITYRGKPAADGPRYKALGNSMAVPVVRWILERIEQMETADRKASGGKGWG